MLERYRRSTLIIAPKRSGTNFTNDLLVPYHVSSVNEPIGLHSKEGSTARNNPLSPWMYSGPEHVSREFGHTGLADDPYGALLARSFVEWLSEGKKLIKETDFLSLGWTLGSVPLNTVTIKRDPRGSIASFKKHGFYDSWGYNQRLLQFVQTIQTHPVLDALYGGFVKDNPLETNPWHRQLAFYYSVALLEISRNLKGRKAHVVDYKELTEDPQSAFEKIFSFLELPFDERIERAIYERTSYTRNRLDPFSVFKSSMDQVPFERVLTPNEEADIRAICREFGIDLDRPSIPVFESSLPDFSDTRKKEYVKLANKGRKNILEEIQLKAKKVPIGNDYLYVSETLVINDQFAQFLYWLKTYDIPIEVNGKPIFYNDRPQSRLHIKGDAIIVDRGYEAHPVTFVNWLGAAVFCAWVGGRLPTKAEWERAILSKAFDRRDGHEAFTKDLVNIGQYYGTTTPVDNFAPNGFGIYDEIGNTSIWLSDQGNESPFEGYKAGIEWNHSIDHGIFPSPRPHWFGTSGLGFRVVFDKIGNEQTDEMLLEQVWEIMEFLIDTYHEDTSNAHRVLFEKVDSLWNVHAQ